MLARLAGIVMRLTGFPDVEGIETQPVVSVLSLDGLTGFPDVEGIETHQSDTVLGHLGLTGFPDVEGIETIDS